MIDDGYLVPKNRQLHYIITKLSPLVVNWQHLQATEIIIYLEFWLTTVTTYCLYKPDSEFRQDTNLVASNHLM